MNDSERQFAQQIISESEAHYYYIEWCKLKEEKKILEQKIFELERRLKHGNGN